MPMVEQREYRSMMLRAKERAQDDAAGFIVEGYCTTYNDPYELYSRDGITVMEQVAPGAFDNTDISDVIMQYDHQGHVYARNSNNTLSLADDEHGFSCRADLSGTAIGRQLYEEIAGGYTTKMSFGFTISSKEQLITENEDGSVTVLETITGVKKLYDVSAVSLPANPGTEIEATRSAYAAGVADEVRQEMEKKRAADRKRQAMALKIKIALEG